MSPHSDVPSPVSSHSNSPVMASRPIHGSGLRNRSSIYTESHSQYSSSFDSASTSLSEPDDHIHRPLIPGVYVPTVCFFEPETEDLDLPTISTHAVRLARAGVAGIATQGSNGEAVHLSPSERCLVTSTTRAALRDSGFDHLPIIVGCGAQSTREAIQHCRDAYASGADYALVLPPSYYAPLFAPNSKSVIDFFTDVANASPIPLLIYNYPGAVSGMDLSSDTIIALAAHPNIVGVKLTCGNTGKLNRVASATRAKSTGPYSAANPPPFLVLAGSADFTLQSLIAGGHGILAGLANIAPKACVETIARYQRGTLPEAQAIQEIVARGDWQAIQGGIVGTKAGLEALFGYGGFGRAPLPRPEKGRWDTAFRELGALEASL